MHPYWSKLFACADVFLKCTYSHWFLVIVSFPVIDVFQEPPTAIETISLSAYLKTIKESKKHLHIRTDMLDELKLAENVEEIDVSVYVEPSTKPKSAGAPDPAGAMCATSLVVKYARRLVSAF